MKVVLVAFAIFAIAAAEEWKPKTPEEIATIRQECLEELKVPEADRELIKKFDYQDNETHRCYVKCSVTKNGFWNDSTGFDIGRVVDQLAQGRDKATFREEVAKCVDSNPDKLDACTWAFRNFRCFIANNLLVVKSAVKA